jgi:hypothetical protein
VTADKAEAEKVAIESARNELTPMLASPSDQPTFTVVEVTEIKDGSAVEAVGRGFLFF